MNLWKRTKAHLRRWWAGDQNVKSHPDYFEVIQRVSDRNQSEGGPKIDAKKAREMHAVIERKREMRKRRRRPR